MIIINIATLLFWKQDENILLDDAKQIEINSKKPVATIGNEKVYYKEWTNEMLGDYGESQLKALIDRSVVKQLANKKDIHIDEKVVKRESALLITMQGIKTKEEIAILEEKWRELILYRYKLEALLTEDVIIPEEEIRTFYDNYQKQYDFNASMQLSHIVVKDMKTAGKIIQELNEGASFHLLAMEYSVDEETKNDGGYLGFLETTSQFMPNGYSRVAAKMEQHSYSEPIEIDTGHVAIIYLHQALPQVT